MRTLNEVCQEIAQDWRPMGYAAKPYFVAMSQMETVSSPYYDDSGPSVVLYFLSNAQSWKGEVARRVKKELKAMLKAAGH